MNFSVGRFFPLFPLFTAKAEKKVSINDKIYHIALKDGDEAFLIRQKSHNFLYFF